MNEIAVLVLNFTYEPLHFTNAKRAITLLLSGRAEIVETSPRVVRSPSRSFHLPAVIRLGAYIRKPLLERVAFNKKNILRRDGYTCQYCSRRGEKLTGASFRCGQQPFPAQFAFDRVAGGFGAGPAVAGSVTVQRLGPVGG